MNDHAAIRATFSDFRLVKGRKVVQWIFESPIEEADIGLNALGGVPMAATERWCGIARLKPEAAQRPALARDDDKERRPFHTLPYAQQAALKCNDAAFREFLNVSTPEAAAVAVRGECGVTSRGEIEIDPKAKERWLQILRDFDQWKAGYR